MSKIRVLHIVTRLAVRGAPRYVLNVAGGLDAARFEVEVVAGRSEPGEGSLLEEARARGIATISVEAMQRAVSPAADWRAWRALRQILARGRYDIVHTHISKAGVLGRLAARQAGVPVVLHTYHGRVEELERGSFKSRLLLAAERRAARASDALVAVSRDTLDYLQEGAIAAPQQCHLIHNGVDLGFFDAGQSLAALNLPDGPALGTLGSLTREKGIDVLLKAMASLGPPFADLRLYVIGDGPLLGPLKALSAQLGLEERVEFVGIVDDVRPWLAAFDLFVQPSISEGMATALLEAMAMGQPVVASSVGGAPEVVCDGRTGRLVPPGDPQALGAAIAEALSDDEMRRAWGLAGRRRAQEAFDMDAMIRRIEKLYLELLAAKR